MLAGYNGPSHKAHKTLEDIEKYAELEKDPALRDPPRPGVKESIQRCKDAGINFYLILQEFP